MKEAIRPRLFIRSYQFMSPLILSRKKTRSLTPAESFDPNWVEQVATRWRLAKNCLSPGSAAPQDRYALGILIEHDIPEMLEKVTELMRSS